jgi:hypothetical protein
LPTEGEAVAELQRSEVLCIPKRRRLLHSKLNDAEGNEVLHIFYGEKEIIFDEPELVPFGEKLLELERFRAEEAMSWSNGAPHDWAKVREMLEALLDQEILKRIAEEEVSTGARTFPATLGLAPPGRQPRTFSAEDNRCPAIMQEALGRAVDLSNLEAVVPVYRTAHPALDTDGRQVGENNVFLPSLFLDLPTQRRLCNYSGNRYQADVPMNVTALKHMTSRWPELLSLTEQSRQAIFARLPTRGSSLRTGELHLLTVCTLASVGYVMVRGTDPVANGKLDAGLAAMFRLIDGVRLVTTELMRATAGEHGCDRPVTAQSVADYAEKQGMYRGTFGVCAGPQALIDEYLRVLLGETSAPVQVEPDLASRVGDMNAALDYGLLGQRIEAMVRIFGASQGLLHDRLRIAFQDHGQHRKLKELLDEPIDTKRYQFFREDHPLVENFKLEIDVNRWLLARAGEGLATGAAGVDDTVDALLRLDPASQEVSRGRLAEFFARVLANGESSTKQRLLELAAVASDVFTLERRCLRFVRSEQRKLNERLRRPFGRTLTGEDLALFNQPRTGRPFAVTLSEGLGVSVTTDHVSTVMSYENQSLSLTD